MADVLLCALKASRVPVVFFLDQIECSFAVRAHLSEMPKSCGPGFVRKECTIAPPPSASQNTTLRIVQTFVGVDVSHCCFLGLLPNLISLFSNQLPPHAELFMSSTLPFIRRAYANIPKV